MHSRWLPHLLVAASVACGGASSSLLDPQDAAEPVADATSQDVAVSPDAGSDVTAVDASKDVAAKDVGNPYTDPGIACGTGECDAGSALCCGTITSYYPTYTYSFACEPTTDIAQCPAGLPIYCDDDHDCPTSQICCGDLGNNGYNKVSCKATCTGIVFYYQQIHFCNPKANDCSSTQSCVASTVLSGYYVCQ
jgi:hypothetical protein